MNEEIDIEEWAPGLVLFFTLLGGFLRVLLLGTKGMWLDETFSVWVANHSIPEMLHWVVQIDQHPPLYYLLLHYWIALKGDTPYYVRLFSVLFGAGTIPVIYLIGKRMSGAVVGLIAAMFLALSPFNIYFAQEARMYTFLTFNAAVAIYALVRLLTDPRAANPIGSQLREYLKVWHTGETVHSGSEGDLSYLAERPQTGWRGWIYRHGWSPIRSIETDLAWAAFIVFSVATLLSHNTAVFFVLATNLFVLGLLFFQWMKRSGSLPVFLAPSFGNWVKAQIGIFILWSPWLFAFIRQSSRVNQEFWIPAPDQDTVTRTLRYLLNNLVPNPAIQTTMMWILCIVLCLGLMYYRKKLSIFLFLAALFAVPFLGELIVSIQRPIFLDRTLIWITIPLLLLLAAGIAQLRFRFLMIVALGIIGTNYLFADGDIYRFVQKEDWNTAAGYVANFAEKDDLVLFNSNVTVIPFNYYFKAYEDKYFIQVEKQGTPADLFESGIMEPKMTENDIPGLVSLLRGHDRVWLVYSHNSYTDPMGLIPQTLAAQMKLTQQRDFYGGEVQLYEAP